MKRILTALSIISIALLASCGGKSTSTTSTSSTDSVSKTAERGRDKNIIMTCCDGITAPDTNTMIEFRQANINVTLYSQDYNTGNVLPKNNTALSFYYNADSNMTTFLNVLNNYNAAYIHFILSYNHSNNNKLVLLMSALDSAGDHIYMEDSIVPAYPKYWMFKGLYPDVPPASPTNPRIDVTPQGGAATVQAIPGDPNLLNVAKVVTYVNYYNQNVLVKEDNICSFVFPYKTFVDYYNKAKAVGLSKIEVILAERTDLSPTQFTLIITGIDAMHNQILIKDASNAMNMLEFCSPCPFCEGILCDCYGLSLEIPHVANFGDAMRHGRGNGNGNGNKK